MTVCNENRVEVMSPQRIITDSTVYYFSSVFWFLRPATLMFWSLRSQLQQEAGLNDEKASFSGHVLSSAMPITWQLSSSEC